MRYFKILIILTGLWGINLITSAQNFREESNISKTFKIAPSGTLELSNKYGSIYVDTWDKDSVKIDIEFIIAEKNENRFKKLKNSVNFDFAGNNLYRTVKTQYGNSYSSLFKDLKEATNLFSSNADQTHVDYYITMPNYINLKIDNKYGNIILPSLLGDTHIKLSNGDFQARELKGNNQLELSFGSARLNAIEHGNLKLNFLETSITKANNLTIESKSSNLNIEQANLLKINSKRGDIEINNTNYLFSETEFCQLFIDNISSEANIRLKYGILKKLNCQSGFESINIYSTHADVWLKLPKEDAYNIKTSYLKANCSSDKSILWEPAEVADEKGTLTKSGYHLNKNSSANVKIEITEGNLNID